ncbi:TPA: TonB-dependent receptor [Klebsiella oxytoca]
MKRSLLSLLVISAIFAETGFTWAADIDTSDDADQGDSETMVVTASPIEKSMKEAPASMSVITQKDIQQNISKSANDITDLLEQVPGISKAITTNASGTGIQIRGMPAAYTLILVDGRRLGSSYNTRRVQQDSYDDMNWVPVEDIERIEIVKGPMSALYGSDAMGGVVNIITKKNTKAWHGSFTVGGILPEDRNRGRTSSYSGSMGGAITDDLSVRLNGSLVRRAADTSEGNNLRFGNGEEGQKRYNLGADFDWKINDENSLVFGVMRNRQKGLEGKSSTGNTISLRSPTELKRESYYIGHTGLYSFGSTKITAYENRYRNKVSDSPDNEAKERLVEGSITTPFEWGVYQELTMGASWQKEYIDNQQLIDSSFKTSNNITSKAIFGEDNIDLLDDLTLTLGLRYDNTDYGNAFTPRAYLVYDVPQIDGLTIKGGYSQGFKTPTLNQVTSGWTETSQGASCSSYSDYVSGSGCYIKANPDLRPEKSQNYEIGLQYQKNGWDTGLTFFDNHFKDKIETAPLGYLSDGNYYMQYINSSRARTQGIEGNLNIPLISSSNKWFNKLTWRNNFTKMTKAEDSSGVILVTTPKLTVFSALDLELNEKASFGLSAKYYSKMLGTSSSSYSAAIRSGYTIWGVSGQYRISKDWRANYGIDNLFDKNPISEVSYSSGSYYVPGRTFYGSLTYSF